jgi:hypothetical protein
MKRNEAVQDCFGYFVVRFFKGRSEEYAVIFVNIMPWRSLGNALCSTIG